MKRNSLLVFCLVLLFFSISVPAFAGSEWLPVTPEELSMKESPAGPGAHAVILYHENYQDDTLKSDTEYFRIKILSEEGKKWANVETAIDWRSDVKIENIRARTIQPDGTIVPFTGKVFDKMIKRRGYRFLAKAFTMPEVRVGSIIEYKYTSHWNPYYVYDSRWTVQQPLFTRKQHFFLRPSKHFQLAWVVFFLPAQLKPTEQHNGDLIMDAENILGLDKEEMMPPEDELRARVQFFYIDSVNVPSPDEIWKNAAKEWSKQAEGFMKKGAAEQELRAAIAPSDAPELKLQKIYERAQKIRNLTYEEWKTEKEEKQENLKPNMNTDDVLKHGYGTHDQINRTFAAMARVAGFDATLIRVAERDTNYFHKEVPSIRQFTSEIVYLKQGDKEMYFDPGTPYCPFALLPWEAMGTTGLMLAKEARFVNTPTPDSANAKRVRQAKLRLESDGTASGTLHVEFAGQYALNRRLHARDEDDTQKKKDLVELFQEWLPGGAVVEIKSVNDWHSSTQPLVVDASITVPGLVNRTGKRMLLPATLFPGSSKTPFPHARRTYPIHMHYPYQETDEISLTLPEGLQPDSLPTSRNISSAFGTYTSLYRREGNEFTGKRQFIVNSTFIPLEYYEELRGFYDNMRVSDNDQAVFKVAATNAGN